MRGLMVGVSAAVAAMALLDHGQPHGTPFIPPPEPWPPQKFHGSRGSKGKSNRGPSWGKHKGSKRAKKASRKGGNPSKS